MVCKKAYWKGTMPIGCGQCLPCRINRQRLWTHRILLEQRMHGDCSFVGLSYDDKYLPGKPESFGPAHFGHNSTLVPKHIQKFIKRLRKQWPAKLRYFYVGEYGDEGQRAHYHLALFGYPTCMRGRTEHRAAVCCIHCERIKKVWGMGSVDVGTLTKDSAAYVSQYVTKKMTNKNDEKTAIYLAGRHPEFARMSLKPGIGASAMEVVGNAILPYLSNISEPPTVLQHGSKKLPLGRYLKNKLRIKLGLPEPKKLKEMTYEEAKIYWEEKMSYMPELHEAIQIDEEGYKGPKAIYKKITKQKILNLESKYKIFDK